MVIVVMVIIFIMNRVKNVLIMCLILFYFNLKVEVRNLYILYISIIFGCYFVIVILVWWDLIFNWYNENFIIICFMCCI